MSPVRRTSRDLPPVALPLDELLDVARHLSDEQTHRNVGKRKRQNERDEERSDESGECQDRRHLHALNSKRPAEERVIRLPFR